MGGDTQSGEHDTLGENWLYGAVFRGFQKTAGPRCVLFIYRLDVVAALCAEGVRVDVTQMFSKGPRGLSVSPFFPGAMGPWGGMVSLTLGNSTKSGWGASPPLCILGFVPWGGGSRAAQPELPGETQPPAQPTLRAWPADALPPALQMGEKTTRRIQGPELSGARHPPPHPAPKHQPSAPFPGLSGGTASPRLPPRPCLGAASRALAAHGQSSSFITLCRPGPAVAVCNRGAGRERKFLKSGLGKN